MYQALYRKYRPRTFSDVAGQDHITVTLRRQIVSGRQSHAYLFVGTRGTGKTTCAKILSRAINCQNPVDGDPCNKCPSCMGIENGSILDILELDAASNNGVDDVRALREEAIYSPASVNKRVYIIDEAHMLSNSAFNALLKILEEPPEHLVFILATTALHKIPATILGRCQRFSFKRLSPAAIFARLKYVAENEGFTLTDEAAKLLATLADGSMRDALSLLDQCATEAVVDQQRVLDTIGLVGRQEVWNLIEAVSKRDTMTALGIFDAIYNDGRDMSSLFSEMASLMRDVLVYKLSPESPLLSGRFGREELSSLAVNLSHERLYFYLDVIRGAVMSLSRGDNVKTTVEINLIRMCDERLSDDMPSLLARIEALEFGIRNSEFGIKDEADNAESVPSLVGADGPVSPSLEIPPQPVGCGADEPPLLDAPFLPAQTDHETDAYAHNSELQIPNSELREDFWSSILEQLKDDMPIYSLLSNNTRVQAEQQDSALVIRAGDSFTVDLIKSKKFIDPLTEAARKILGENATIRVEAGDGAAPTIKAKKIDDLGRFDIVRFE